MRETHEGKRKARDDEPKRGGAALRGMESSGPGPGSERERVRENPNEKSVIIIITAERTTIINHH